MAQALAAKFFDDEHWEWNQVADWLLDTYLPLEARLRRLRALLDLQGVTYVTWEEPEPDETAQVILDGLGMRLGVRRERGRNLRVLLLGVT
jgi:hypothetical protein